MRVTALSIVMALLLCASISHARIQDNYLTIHGCVKNELQLTPAALKKFDQTDVQLNDIQKDGQFKGIFNFRGVPLKTLLQLAGIEKKESDFNKPVDLVIVVKNPFGDQAVLSWGEIFFKNPSHVLVGLSANPIQPHKGADHFKDKKAYATMMETLNRMIAFPRLIISQERFSDRCLESISDIEVIDLKPKVTGEKSPSVFSDSFNLVEKGAAPVHINELPQKPRVTIQAHVVGLGRGYHGTHHFTGVPLTTLLSDMEATMDLNTVFVVSAPDAYRALLSYGEVFLGVHGQRIIVVDEVDGQKWQNGGRFVLVLPDDLMADREVKAIGKIEVISLFK